ncbi:lipid storage droplets surface-binding protein 1 [Anabrus simplex]|uniref:lipid storage droplets surface-binding protein 1 n=1 Tax=Anabrus simplex TaxID=316456 RepID=UPI0035A2F7A3
MASNLESVKKIIQLPIVEEMLKSSSAVYDIIKNSNAVFNWALSVTESTMQKALQVVGAVAPIPGPLSKKLDQVFVAGISFLEEKMPIVRKPPQEIYQEAKNYVSSKHQQLQNYKDAIFSRAKNSADQTKDKIVSLGNTATQPLRDVVHTSEKFVDEKLIPKAKALATAVATAPDQVLGPVAELYEEITSGAFIKEKAATSQTVSPVTETPTSDTQTSSVAKATT